MANGRKTSPVAGRVTFENRHLVLFGVTLLVMIAPYFRGLYFTGEQLAAIIAGLALFAAGVLLVSEREAFLEGPFDYLAFALPVAYFLSLLVAVDERSAIQATLLRVLYFATFWLVSRLARRRFEIRAVLSLLAISLAAMAIVGIGAAAGDIPYPGAYIWDRIASTVQYPNTAAALFLVGLFLSLGLATQAETRAGRLLYEALGALFPVAFIYTLSRGTWLVAPVAVALFLIALPAGRRWLGLLLGLAALLGNLPGIVLFHHAVKDPSWAWSLTVLGVVLTVLFSELFRIYAAQDPRRQRLIGGSAAAAVILLGGAYLYHRASGPLRLAPGMSVSVPVIPVRGNAAYTLAFQTSGPADGAYDVLVYGVDPQGGKILLVKTSGPVSPSWQTEKLSFHTRSLTSSLLVTTDGEKAGALFRRITLLGGGQNRHISYTLAKILPGRLYRRTAEINPSELSVWERFYYYRDALKMFARRPLLGWGGGGWTDAYMAFQSFGYFSTQVHNAYLQALVNTGIVGFLVFIGIWIVFIITWWKAARAATPPERILLAGAGTAAAVLGMHAVMDFDLSLGSASLILFTLFGIFRGQEALKSSRPLRLAPAWPVSLAAILVILSASLLVGFEDGQSAQAMYRAGQGQASLDEFRAAASHDPWDSSFHLDLGQLEVMDGVQTKQTGLIDQGVADVEQAEKLKQYSSMTESFAGAALFNAGQFTPALAAFRKAIAYRPFGIQGYEEMGQAYQDLGIYYLQNHEYALARRYFSAMLPLRSEMAAVRRRLPKGVPANLNLPPTSPLLHFYFGVAETALGDYAAAHRDFSLAQNAPGQAANLDIWEAALDKLSGNPRGVPALITRAEATNPQAPNVYTALLQDLTASRNNAVGSTIYHKP